MKEKKLVRLWRRASRNGKSFTYYLRYHDLEGNFKTPSLGHSDTRKAEKQRIQKEKELRMGYCPSGSMRLSEFRDDCLERTGDQIREGTRISYRNAINTLIEVIGDIDIKSVTFNHGEKFRQPCLSEGRSPYTVAKKLRSIKVMFNLAVKRKQLDENPLQEVKPPKLPKKGKIHTYNEDECQRLINAASDYQEDWIVEWDLVMTVALTTAMRKSEILNTTWSDIDFENMTIDVNAKEDTEETWAWKIKDSDSRTLPLTEDVVKLLKNLKERRPEGYPYVFISPKRYNRIQVARKGLSKRRNKPWTLQDANNSIVHNFYYMFNEIRALAGITKGTFHDLRKTAITNWVYAGLNEIETMKLAGHSKYETTLGYYLKVKDNHIDKARDAITHKVSKRMLEENNNYKN